MKLHQKTVKFAVLLAALAGFSAIESSAQTCRGPKPTICDRSCWNARAPQCSISQLSALNRAVIHHTASTGDYNTSGLTESKGRVRGTQNYHMDVNGWCDIGYHFLVDKHGNIFSGRKGSATLDEKPRGAHDGCNDNSFGFTALGYYHSPYNNSATSALINGLEKVIAWRLPPGWDATGGGSTYCSGVTDKIIGHRQVSATACPGDILHNKTKDGSGFENAVNARRSCN
jgi:hypothetical protein